MTTFEERVREYIRQRDVRVARALEKESEVYQRLLDERAGVRQKKKEYELEKHKLSRMAGEVLLRKNPVLGMGELCVITKQDITAFLAEEDEKFNQKMAKNRRNVESLYGQGLRQEAKTTVLAEAVKSNLEELLLLPIDVDHVPEGQRRELYALFREETQRFPQMRHAPEPDSGSELREHTHSLEQVLRELKWKRLVSSSRQEKYLDLFVRYEDAPALVQAMLPPPMALAAETVPIPGPSVPALPPLQEEGEDSQFKKEVLVGIFGLTETIAESYVTIPLQVLDEVRHHLTQEIGSEELALELVRENPDILRYANEKKFLKYLSALSIIRVQLREDERVGGKLGEDYALPLHVRRVATLEGALQVKDEVLKVRGKYPAPEHIQPAEEFNLEEYRSRLVGASALSIPMARAIVEASLEFVGENYMPAEYFRKNAHGRATQREISKNFGDTFEQLISNGVLVRKHKAEPLYRINPHPKEVENPYLREYLRVTLYEKQIVAQEGRITPKVDFSTHPPTILNGNGKNGKR